MLSEGEVVASVSTMYRRLRVHKEHRNRRNHRPVQRHVKPQPEAMAPNQIVTWDMTKLLTLTRGLNLNLYFVLYLFSHYAVGWMMSCEDNAGLALHLFSEVLTPRQITTDSSFIWTPASATRCMLGKGARPSSRPIAGSPTWGWPSSLRRMSTPVRLRTSGKSAGQR